MGLSTKILIGMGLGVASGIFFGEEVAFLKIAGDAFILLLQMTVLPYVMVSLITGLGGLSFRQAADLGRKCGLVLLLLWTIGIVAVLSVPLSFPDWESAGFFSTSLIEQRPAFDILGLYIPSNLFYSLANNIVPAVVVFSFALGIALIGVPRKTPLLDDLGALAQGLGRITNFLIGLAPYGVFAIIASATGVMRVEELRRLQVYMVGYVVTSLLLTFGVLPALVTALTPFKYGSLVGPARAALITAFATGNIFVVLPLLADRSKRLLGSLAPGNDADDANVDVIVTTSFSFPNLGKILTLSFVLFAGWFAGADVPPSQYPMFAITGFFSFFGDPNVAIPFLFNLLQIPSDMYRYFPVVDNLVGARFGTLLAAMYTLVLAVLGASAVKGVLRVHWARLLTVTALTLAATGLTMGTVRWYFEHVAGHEYQEYETFIGMNLTRSYERTAEEPPPVTAAIGPEGPLSRLDAIRSRSELRVGYFDDALPFAFVNREGRLVGFDVEMAHALAQAMDVRVAFVRIDRDRIGAALAAVEVDIVMCNVAVTVDTVREMAFSASYMDQTLAFIVKDHRREDFRRRERLKTLEHLRIGVPNLPYYAAKVRDYLPNATLLPLQSPREFFDGSRGELDALVYSAEAGSAWSLVYPAYTVAVPQPDVLSVPLAYGLPRQEPELAEFVNTWLALKEKDRTIATLYDYWILGRNLVEPAPRWSIIRDVLHLLE